ncbi:ADP-ribosylglycohydrolase family protein [Streptomyces sp. NPDC050256]|uniref:ADP-ribosylglycohydrolase family protein n=1 Tax=Streptomyces sp. NPDC050256 TaxID=3365607 RepID=UPI003799839B
MLLGLALGETLGTAGGELPGHGPLRAGVCTQLACFTVEGSIRALVRGKHKGICHAPSVLWHAYCRWAAIQGIERHRMERRWGGHGSAWPDGWLAQVPVLAERRGSAPATVAALSRIEHGTQGRPTTSSSGWHALGRTLPTAALGVLNSGSSMSTDAREVAALTHGSAEAQSATAYAVAVLRHCLGEGRIGDSLQTGMSDVRSGEGAADGGEYSRLNAALQAAADQPADPTRLAVLAPDLTATSALLGGLYVATSFPDRTQVATAMRFAALSPAGSSVACVTGALLGATHGVEALPVDLMSRHELAWVLDTLARDLDAEVTHSPGGSEYVEGWDPQWSNRYPGW